ncbi:DUF1788 domain-containing protein [Vreelandella rituensis]|uniref:DUF1788 domain-containing protein n=2 Tax=Vreelandella rituensis TaxID=2282306 RepID=A0A368TWH0_9GAMM|nr:DUF1788 domain-containing protein [Halomonas rituensis]
MPSFPRSGDEQLQARLNQVSEKIARPEFLAGQGLGNEIGFWIFDYLPEQELQVREYLEFLPALMERQHPELRVAQVNLLRVVRDYLNERGFLDKAIKMQQSKGDAALLKALRGPLHMDKFAPYLIRHSLSHDPDIVLLTGVGSIWPMMRAHNLLNALHGPLGHKPLVLFYPGRYDGQSLTLFNQIASNHYYRAFALVP